MAIWAIGDAKVTKAQSRHKQNAEAFYRKKCDSELISKYLSSSAYFL
jgi:hypothetical protein